MTSYLDDTDRPWLTRSRRDIVVVWIFAAVAAFRVFVLCASFPLFNNVDEQAHFDLVVKYSEGQIPRGLTNFSEESAADIAYYESPEFLTRPRGRLGGVWIPPWAYRQESIAPWLEKKTNNWQLRINHECNEPPLYYALAGVWRRLGWFLGMKGGYLIYWIRFLNPFVAAFLVWIGFFSARVTCPERSLVRLGTPLFLAIFPQDAFYSIESDVLSPLFGGLAFWGLAKWLRTGRLSVSWAMAIGLSLAAAGLVKGANWPLVAVAAVSLILGLARLAQGGAAWLSGILALLCASVPLAGWAIRDWNVLGDMTGTTAKIHNRGWMRKPLSQWFHHPLFTPKGLLDFWSELLASFWRGEFFWHKARMAFGFVDVFYWLSSLVLLIVALAALMRRPKTTTLAAGNPPESAAATADLRPGLWLAFAMFAASVLFLMMISVAFDFGDCAYPSQEHPFFTSGRLLSGVLVPFLLLYTFGLDRLLGFLTDGRPRWFVVAAMVGLICASEMVLNGSVLLSGYNWFHLP